MPTAPLTGLVQLVTIKASPERVFDAVATAEGIRNWWTRDAAVEPIPGGKAEFGFYGRRFVIRATVDDVASDSRVVWRDVTSSHGAFDGTSISFDIRPNGNGTELRFAHRGFTSGEEAVASATSRWGYYLLSLKRYLETGNGSPNPDDSDAP